MNSDRFVDIPPCFQIVAPGHLDQSDKIKIIINPGEGFGDGTHPTTQLCLQAIRAYAPRDRSWRLLDFGSGSGILSIGAAKLGARVVGVEIERPAIDEAIENSRLNSIEDRIDYRTTLDDVSGSFDIVVANILRPVLVDYAAQLCSRLVPGGRLILSGLVATDVPQVRVRYTSILGEQPELFSRDEWRALVY
jgi:ribosomal protein L11 methyltransferase